MAAKVVEKRFRVNLRERAGRKLVKLAKATNRTYAGTVEWLLEKETHETPRHKTASDNGNEA